MSITLNGTTGIVTPKLDALDLELGSKNVVERGSNANGEYVRFADGTQICTSPGRALAYTNTSNLRTEWTYPASFAATPWAGGNAVGELATTKQITIAAAYARNATDASISLLSLGIFVAGDATGSSMDCLAIGRWY